MALMVMVTSWRASSWRAKRSASASLTAQVGMARKFVISSRIFSGVGDGSRARKPSTATSRFFKFSTRVFLGNIIAGNDFGSIPVRAEWFGNAQHVDDDIRLQTALQELRDGRRDHVRQSLVGNFVAGNLVRRSAKVGK